VRVSGPPLHAGSDPRHARVCEAIVRVRLLQWQRIRPADELQLRQPRLLLWLLLL
jgi:hypothetical protein